MRANSLPLLLQIQPAEVHPTARHAATRRQGWQHGPAWGPAGQSRCPSCYGSTSFCNGTCRRIYLATSKDFFFIIPSPLSQTKVHFHPTSQPWKTCSTTCCRFSLSNTCHNTWLDSFLPPSHFLSSHLCRLCSKHNFWLKSSSTGHFKCYQQGQTSPSSSSLHLTPKDQLMKCKTSGLFD